MDKIKSFCLLAVLFLACFQAASTEIPRFRVNRSKNHLYVDFGDKNLSSIQEPSITFDSNLYYFVEPTEKPTIFKVWIWSISDLKSLGDYSHVCWQATRYYFDVSTKSEESTFAIETPGRFLFDGSVEFGPISAAVSIDRIWGIPTSSANPKPFRLQRVSEYPIHTAQ